MKKHIEQLHSLANKPYRKIIGLMSGTSLDGLDVALCRCEGSGLASNVSILEFKTIPYSAAIKEKILPVFSKREGDIERMVLLNGWIGCQHADMILNCLKEWNIKPENVDLIASHGQTIYHAPKRLHQQAEFGNATLQLGDGDHIAVKTGIITVSDFRQKHIASGGEGAPLAAYGDYLIFSKKDENRIMLNIGGIANFTWLPGNMNAAEVFSTDTGTGNTLMDAYVQKHFPGKYCDRDAALAKQGTVLEPLLDALLDHPFFKSGFPKTIGPELFNLSYLDAAKQKAGLLEASHYDLLATLNAFSATSIAEALRRTLKGRTDFTVFVSGGGMHNPLLMESISNLMPGVLFTTTQDLEINPDAKEALLFAILANECVAGSAEGPGNIEEGIPAVTMGKISFPS